MSVWIQFKYYTDKDKQVQWINDLSCCTSFKNIFSKFKK